MGKEKTKYLFGPVPSRRLGLSLGVDIVPLKTCTQNCVYCQLGTDGVQTLRRKAYVPIDAVVCELQERISAGLAADYITLSGSGEPTLNSQIGDLIEKIKNITKIPVAVLTNGSLFTDPQVRIECAKADVVLPSLDAGSSEAFEKINCPHKDIRFEDFVEGLCRFRGEFSGQIWLEVFLIEGINTDNAEIERIKGMIERIKPNKVQLNTAVRPTTDRSVVQVEQSRLEDIAGRLGGRAEVVADFAKVADVKDLSVNTDIIIDMLKRRPCSPDDVCASLGIDRDEALKYLSRLEKQGLIVSEQRENILFFKLE